MSLYRLDVFSYSVAAEYRSIVTAWGVAAVVGDVDCRDWHVVNSSRWNWGRDSFPAPFAHNSILICQKILPYISYLQILLCSTHFLTAHSSVVVSHMNIVHQTTHPNGRLFATDMTDCLWAMTYLLHLMHTRETIQDIITLFSKCYRWRICIDTSCYCCITLPYDVQPIQIVLRVGN